MKRHRLGVALMIPEPIAIEINALRRAFGATNIDRIEPHITLIAPVNVRADALNECLERFRVSVSECSPMQFEVGPIETFLPLNPVAYLAVRGDIDALKALRHKVNVAPLDRAESREFVAHATVVESSNADHLADVVAAAATYRATLTIDCVHVLELGTDEAGVQRWHRLIDAPLAAPTSVGRGSLPLSLTVHEHHGLLEILARRDQRVIGRAATWLPSRRVLMIEVDEASRHSGVGAHLLAATEHAARQRGLFQLFAARHEFLIARGWTGVDELTRVL